MWLKMEGFFLESDQDSKHLKLLLKMNSCFYRVNKTQRIYCKRSSVAKNELLFVQNEQDSKDLKEVVLLKMNSYLYRVNRTQST